MKRLVWIDIETTGLDPSSNKLLEICVVITNEKMDADGCFSQILPLMESDLTYFHPAALHMHIGNGLIERCLDIHQTETMSNVEVGLCQFFLAHEVAGLLPAGSSVHFDMRWLRHLMPTAVKFLHDYRVFDLASLRTIWKPEEEEPSADEKHRACPDVFRDIAYLRKFMRRFDAPVD